MKSITLTEIAVLCDARLEGVGVEVDGSRRIVGPASLEDASPDEISFLADRRQARHLAETRAAAVIVGAEVGSERPDLVLLRCADPQRAFNRVVEAFAPERPTPAPGIHPSAVVDPAASLAPDVSVGPLCVVQEGAELASGCVLHPLVTVGARARIGPGTQLYPGVCIYPHVQIGARCVVHAGAVIGSDGFGFEPGEEGWTKTPQGGTVVIEDDVEIGANVTIDCARFKATRIESNVKIDNLVHVGHNCHIGSSAMLVAQSGIAGSTRVGPSAILAGQVGVAGHLEIGAGARIGGASAVFRNVPPGEDWWGVPAAPKNEAIRRTNLPGRTERLAQALRALERRVAELEERP